MSYRDDVYEYDRRPRRRAEEELSLIHILLETIFSL